MARASPIIVIADDLSGAAELAGIAYAHGLRAEVQRRFVRGSDADVIAIDSDTRSLPPHVAAKQVQDVAEQVIAARPAWIFKKVDSVLRGNVRSEMEAMLWATGQSRALLVPANPTRGRIITGGRYLIDAVPLDQTLLGRDAQHPRQSANIDQLLGYGAVPLRLVSSDASLPNDGIIVPDVSSEAELARLVRQADSAILLAGAADFFTAVLTNRCKSSTIRTENPAHLDPPALLVCGSRVSWNTRRQACLAAGISISTVGESTEPAKCGALLLGIGEQIVTDQTAALAALSEAAAAIIGTASISTLLAEGGATAAAIAQRQSWNRFDVVANAPAGVGVLRPIAPRSPLVLIKPGSYPWPLDIWQAFIHCHKQAP